MTGDQLIAMRRELLADEGVRLRPYQCSSGKWTIGVGFNYEDRGLDVLEAIIGRPINLAVGITKAEALVALDADIQYYESRVRARFPTIYDRLDPVRQRAMVNFAFNLGGRALGFRSALARLKQALDQTDPELQQACWDATAFHLMNSLWARQVDDGLAGRRGRADRICEMVRLGQAPRIAA